MLDPQRYEAIDIDKRADGIVLATLNRPDRLNAVNAAMHAELARLTREADADPVVKVIVITGAGRAFCAGGDFGPQPADATGGMTLEEGRQIVDHMLECSKPIISAVNGYAMGLGATVALLADIVYAARSATFADTHVKMGIGAGDGGQVIWPLLMGVNRAKYYLMTGDRLTATEAERLGLVNFVVDDGTVVDEALALASRLAAGPSLAISASKVAVNSYMRMISSLVLPLSLSVEGRTMASEDHREAVRAFQEKRTPTFNGR
ncbi:MAG: enoyl-CoA hydratase [Ilumatobacteraceae bacterium]|nr:enoyl-CoA hydratase [Ilumatobacteraceae bacterium]